VFDPSSRQLRRDSLATNLLTPKSGCGWGCGCGFLFLILGDLFVILWWGDRRCDWVKPVIFEFGGAGRGLAVYSGPPRSGCQLNQRKTSVWYR
jgi:hypothetical protein